jgi:HAD superfamily hydrolase (TIGR01509 family)
VVEPGGVEALLVDFDGTLVSLGVDWDQVRADLAALFRRWSVESTFRPLNPEIARALADVAGRAPGEAAEARTAAFDLLRRHEVEAADRAEPLDGARELLEWASDRRLPVAVISSNSVDAIERVVRRFAWPPPAAVVGRETVDAAKPDPEGARLALHTLGVRGERAVMVGDSDYDVEVGRAVGAATVWVRTGGFRQLNYTRADASVASLRELPPLLSGWRPAAAGNRPGD